MLQFRNASATNQIRSQRAARRSLAERFAASDATIPQMGPEAGNSMASSCSERRQFSPLRLLIDRSECELWTPMASAALLLSTTLAGCGGSAPAPAPTQTSTSVEPQQATASSNASTPDGATETKWLGKVPYDVFYDQPLAKVGGPSELGAAVSVAMTPAPGNTASSVAPTTSMTDAGDTSTSVAPSVEGTDWGTLIAGEVLDAESKVIRTRLTANLQSVSTYNRSIDAITTDAIIMAALAGVAERYNGEMRWKERSPEVRTLAYTVYENVGDKGRKAFDATSLPFEEMLTLLNGGNVDVEDVETEVPFSDYAFRSSLMERVDSTFNWLRSNIASEANLKSSQEDVVREASVMAMIGGMIKDESYEFYEEENYQKYSDDFISASVDAAQAARDGNFSTFQDAIGRMNTSCGNCHGEYSLKDDSL